jgi:lipopolysaccharide export system permease protein
MIKRKKMKGNSNVTSFYNELYQRTSMPVSIIILTFLGLSLSSQKKRGGLGLNLALGIALAFLFVFSFQVLNVVSENKTLPPLASNVASEYRFCTDCSISLYQESKSINFNFL